MKLARRTVVALLCMALAGRSLLAADPSRSQASPTSKKTVRVLTIGNSFSQDATAFLAKLAEADGNTLILKTASIGGSPLQLHWEKSQLHERSPEDRAGHYGSGRGLKQILLDGPHDFVTIQQRSISSHDPATYRPYAAQLQAYVKQHAPQAELLLHETWAYRVDDRRFAPAAPPPAAQQPAVQQPAPPKSAAQQPAAAQAAEPRTQRAMYEQLARAYRTIAGELGVRIIPVGDAFYAADTDPRRGYRPDSAFDARQAMPPTLPDQTHSLHVGYKWQTVGQGKSTLGMDGHHASPAGRYLGACVWYETLFGRSCVGNTFTASLDADYARFLQTTAHDAVTKAAANPPSGGKRQTRNVEGWTLHISDELFEKEMTATTRALELLAVQLQEIDRVVPATAVAELKKVPLWFSPEYPGVQPRAEYHPDAGWLRKNGRDPAMAKAIEFTNVRIFERETKRMPNFALHELAHAYHDRVLAQGFGNAQIKATFEKAKKDGTYERVEQRFGDGRTATVRAYAMTTPMEYFAENTEAYFSRNDFFPFDRDQLARHDPEFFAVLKTLWSDGR